MQLPQRALGSLKAAGSSERSDTKQEKCVTTVKNLPFAPLCGGGGQLSLSLPLIINSFENMLFNNFNERVTLLIRKVHRQN